MVFPEPVNFTGIDSIFIYMNTISDGWGMTIFLITMHVVFLAFMVRKGNDTMQSLMASTYVIMVAVGFMFAMGAIPTVVVSFYVVLSGAMFLIYFANRE